MVIICNNQWRLSAKQFSRSACLELLVAQGWSAKTAMTYTKLAKSTCIPGFYILLLHYLHYFPHIAADFCLERWSYNYTTACFSVLYHHACTRQNTLSSYAHVQSTEALSGRKSNFCRSIIIIISFKCVQFVTCTSGFFLVISLSSLLFLHRC